MIGSVDIYPKDNLSIFSNTNNDLIIEHDLGEIMTWNYDFIDQLNAIRKHNGREEVEYNPNLMWVTKYIVEDNVERGGISHKDRNGKWHWDRLKDFGIAYKWAQEVLACGGGKGISASLDGWMKSSGHRDAILHKEAKGLALYSYSRKGGKYAYFDGIERYFGVVLTNE